MCHVFDFEVIILSKSPSVCSIFSVFSRSCSRTWGTFSTRQERSPHTSITKWRAQMGSQSRDFLVGLGKCPSSKQLGICHVHAAHKGFFFPLLSEVRKCKITLQFSLVQLLPLKVQPFYRKTITWRQIRPQHKHQRCLIKHREWKTWILGSFVQD